MEYWNGLNGYKYLIQYRTEASTYIFIVTLLELLVTLGSFKFFGVKGHLRISIRHNEL